MILVRDEGLKSGAVKSVVAVSSILMLLLSAGCSDLHNLVWNKADTFIDGHHIVISPCRNSYTKTIMDTPAERNHIFGCGKDVAVQIKNEELIVNDKSYGTLGKGDSILVKNGKVFVNDKEPAVVSKNLKGLVRNIESALR